MELKIDKAYCVNLDRRPEKWERFEDAYKQTGLDWNLERFSAVDGSTFTDEFIINSPFKKSGALENRKGRWACALSHANIHKDALENGYEYIAVFEDDCWFKELDTFKEDLENCIKQLPDDWKVLMFGGKPYNKNRKIPEYETYSEDLVIARQVYETHGYIARVPKISKVLIDLWEVKGLGADSATVRDQKNGGHYLTNPILCSQQPGWSDLIHQEAAYHGKTTFKIKKKLPHIEPTTPKNKTLF